MIPSLGLLLGQERALQSFPAAELQYHPRLVAFTAAPAAGADGISSAVLLHPWQWCKVAVAAVVKHCICRLLYSMKSLKGTRIAGAEKLGF